MRRAGLGEFLALQDLRHPGRGDLEQAGNGAHQIPFVSHPDNGLVADRALERRARFQFPGR
jgi:hypothetical protein